MLNTLGKYRKLSLPTDASLFASCTDGDVANHGFLNHGGKSITRQQIDSAFSQWLNIENAFSELLFNGALQSWSDPNNTAIDLDNLDAHNEVEHDGSLRHVILSFSQGLLPLKDLRPLAKSRDCSKTLLAKISHP